MDVESLQARADRLEIRQRRLRAENERLARVNVLLQENLRQTAEELRVSRVHLDQVNRLVHGQSPEFRPDVPSHPIVLLLMRHLHELRQRQVADGRNDSHLTRIARSISLRLKLAWNGRSLNDFMWLLEEHFDGGRDPLSNGGPEPPVSNGGKPPTIAPKPAHRGPGNENEHSQRNAGVPDR